MRKRQTFVLAALALVGWAGFGYLDAAWAAEAESSTFNANESGNAVGMIQLALAAVSVVTLVLLVGYLRYTSPRRRRAEQKGTV